MTLDRPRYSIADIFKAAFIAVAVSSALNIVLWLLAMAVGIVPGDFWVLSPVSIIGSTFAFTLIGAVVLVVLTRTSSNPIGIWRIVAIVGLVLSFTNPFMLLSGSMPGFPIPTASTVAFMLVMHLVAGVAAIYFMTTIPTPRS